MTQITELNKLETKICRGLNSFPARNELIADLVADGWTQAEICRRLNAVRSRMGVPLLTPDAIFAVLRRKSAMSGFDSRKEQPNG